MLEDVCSLRRDHIFISTHQTILLKNMLTFLSCGQGSKVIVFGENGSGKSAVLKQYSLKIKDPGDLKSHIRSLFSIDSLK